MKKMQILIPSAHTPGASHDQFNEFDLYFFLGNYFFHFDSSTYCDGTKIVITKLMQFAFSTWYVCMYALTVTFVVFLIVCNKYLFYN